MCNRVFTYIHSHYSQGNASEWDDSEGSNDSLPGLAGFLHYESMYIRLTVYSLHLPLHYFSYYNPEIDIA